MYYDGQPYCQKRFYIYIEGPIVEIRTIWGGCTIVNNGAYTCRFPFTLNLHHPKQKHRREGPQIDKLPQRPFKGQLFLK